MLPNAVRALRPTGLATAPTPLPVCDSMDRNEAPGQHQGTADARGDQHDDGPTGRDQAAEWFADQCTDPAAGATQRVEVGHDLVGPTDDVQQPQQRQAQQSPTDGQPEPAHALPLADEGGTDGDQRDGHDEPTEAGEPADHGLDPRPSGPARLR